MEDDLEFKRVHTPIIEDIIAGEDKVWVRYKNTGTDPTGNKIELASINIFRIVNGNVVEGWGGAIQKISVPKVTGELYKRLLQRARGSILSFFS